MKALKKTLAIGTGTLVALSGASGMALAVAHSGDEQQSASADERVSQDVYVVEAVQVESVIGEFAYTQDEVTPTETIRKNIGEASKYLCGARPAAEGEAAVEDWEITVNGAVESEFSATFEELAQDERVQTQVMGCSCAGNPADGRASVNAEVTGVPLRVIFDMAQPSGNANTVIITSADGYKIALPLDYLTMRGGMLVFDVNGAPLAESVGGTNQLWLGSTAASYFARDVVSITLEERQTPPPSPNSDEAREAYGNLPNIGVLYGGEVR